MYNLRVEGQWNVEVDSASLEALGNKKCLHVKIDFHLNPTDFHLNHYNSKKHMERYLF